MLDAGARWKRRRIRSNTEHDSAKFEATGRAANKTFMMPMGDTATATELRKLKTDGIREPAKEVNIVPGVHSTLISGPQLANDDYVAIASKRGLSIFDGRTTTI